MRAEQTPSQIYKELFIVMSESGLWADGKTIVDAIEVGYHKQKLLSTSERTLYIVPHIVV